MIVRLSLAIIIAASLFLYLSAGPEREVRGHNRDKERVSHRQTRISYTIQGDSLTVPLLDYFADERPQWQLIDFSSHSGRQIRQAWPLLRKQRLGKIVIFALGTNDRTRSSDDYRQAIERILQYLGPKRCLVLATIYDHGSVERLNSVLRQLDRKYGSRLELADWAKAAESGQVRLADGIHAGTGQGNRLRSQLLLEAATRCRFE